MAPESTDPLTIALSTIVFGSTYSTRGNREEAYHYLTTVQQLCQHIPNKQAIVTAFSYYGKHCYSSQNHDYALQYLSLGVDIANSSGIAQKQAEMLNHQGRLYRQENLNNEAVQCLHKAPSLINRKENPAEFGNTLLNLGNAYHRIGDITKALQYYENALEIGKQESIRHLLAMSLNNIGMLYAVQGHYALA